MRIPARNYPRFGLASENPLIFQGVLRWPQQGSTFVRKLKATAQRSRGSLAELALLDSSACFSM